MRDAGAGVAALLVAALVVILAPVAWSIRETWRPELTIALVAGAVLCAVLLCASPVVMAWRGTWPGRQRDADTVKMIDGSLKLAQRAIPMVQAQEAPAAMPWWQVAEPEHIDVTMQGRD